MSVITDYPTLVQAVSDYTHRTDLGGFVDTFIAGAQAEINKDVFDRNFGNGISFMESAYGPYNITNGVTAIPADYMAPKLFTVTDGQGSVYPLLWKNTTWLYNRYPTRQAQGIPAYIARDTGGFVYGPYPDAAYSVGGTYYATAALLTSTNTTNWMVTSTPNLLLYACMKRAMLFTKDMDGYALWDKVYDDDLAALLDQDKAERWGAATMMIDIA